MLYSLSIEPPLLLTENIDYSLENTVTFEAGENTACTKFVVMDDNIVETIETVELCVVEYNISTTVNILDNDGIDAHFINAVL